MSCRPGLMPPTKAYAVRRLDSVEQEVVLLKKGTGAECLDKVCKSLGIVEREYFGLRYVDKNSEHHWINLRNPLNEQLAPGHRPVMEMRVKYFIKPQKIMQPVTRLHFYKQCKKDLLLGRLKVNISARAARLTALIAQIDKGEYRPGMQYHQKVLCQLENDNLDAKIRREHQKLTGTSIDAAVERFLNEVSAMELYGVELFHVLDGNHEKRVIGVGPENIVIYTSSMEHVHRYPYSAVQYTAFHAKKFSALLTSGSNSPGEQKEFELGSRAAAQALYRTITEFHTFFQRETVSRVVLTAGYCKSLLGNFKGQNIDRFYFDVTRTHREVVDHVWSILHPGTDSAGPTPRHTHRSPSRNSTNSSHSSSSTTATTAVDRSIDSRPPLPPPNRGMFRSRSVHSGPGGSSRHHHQFGSMQRQQMPPLPPYSQRSRSTESGLVGGELSRPRSMAPRHASINHPISPSISENESETESNYGSDTYVSMSSSSVRSSEMAYQPSSQSDPGRFEPYFTSGGSDPGRSEAYFTSGGSEMSGTSLDITRSNSPPPLYSEIERDNEVPFDFTDVPDAGIIHVNPVMPGVGGGDSAVNFDAAAVLARTRELEGELQRLRSTMTCRLCKLNPIGATFCPCGHTVCCFQCAQRLRACWECDQTVTSVQRMLLTH